MSKKGKILLFIGVLIVIGAFVTVNLTKSRGSTIEVTIAQVKKGNITKTVSGSGRVQPELDVKIAARISSEIIKIHVKEGNRVTKGKVLVDLDRQRYEAATEQAESQLTSAQANLKKAQADFSRINNLFERKLSSQADLDAAVATRMSAESQVQQANAYLKQANDDLNKTRLTAPIDGTVSKLFKEEGEIAVGSQFQADPIMTVSDLSRMEVLAEIDENNVVLVSIGDTAKIEVDAIPDTFFLGEVTEIAHTATTRGLGTQEQVTNFEVKIAVVSNAEKLRPGMSATVDINTETHKDVLYIPIQCVTAREIKSDSVQATAVRKAKEKKKSGSGRDDFEDFGPGEEKETKPQQKDLKEVVFTVDNALAKMIPVKTGISDETNIEVTSGLSLGQKIISGSYKALSKTLKEGSKVKEKKELAFRETKESE